MGDPYATYTDDSPSTSEPSEQQQQGRRRARWNSAPSPGPQAKRGRTERHTVIRPGVPPETPWASFHVPDRPSPPLRPDDKDGHYVFELGDNLSSRYKILSKLGEGTFGRVLECWDRKHRQYVAVKVVRNIEKYTNAAMIELEVLNTLEHNDPDGTRHCVALREWFCYRSHVCMVFERLGPSLFDLLRWCRYKPCAAHTVRSFAAQLLESVAFLHDLRLVHTDLKPENILLAKTDDGAPDTGLADIGARAYTVEAEGSARETEIKVIDFGSATFEDQHHSSIVCTRHYRAPEVILGVGWASPCDLWSIGCIIVELATGDALFQTHENLEHLAMMDKVLGPCPASLAACASEPAAKNFDDQGRLRWPANASSSKSKRTVSKLLGLRQMLVQQCDASMHPSLDQLVDLVQSMLTYDPQDRITAREALRHPFFASRPSLPPLFPAAAARPLAPTSSHPRRGAAALPPGIPLPLQKHRRPDVVIVPDVPPAVGSSNGGLREAELGSGLSSWGDGRWGAVAAAAAAVAHIGVLTAGDGGRQAAQAWLAEGGAGGGDPWGTCRVGSGGEGRPALALASSNGNGFAHLPCPPLLKAPSLLQAALEEEGEAVGEEEEDDDDDDDDGGGGGVAGGSEVAASGSEEEDGYQDEDED